MARSPSPSLHHLHHSITPWLDHSITLSLDHSITPSLHHSITPSLHHSITPSLHHSITPSPSMTSSYPFRIEACCQHWASVGGRSWYVSQKRFIIVFCSTCSSYTGTYPLKPTWSSFIYVTRFHHKFCKHSFRHCRSSCSVAIEDFGYQVHSLSTTFEVFLLGDPLPTSCDEQVSCQTVPLYSDQGILS